MRAIVIDKPGSYGRLRLAEMPDPVPRPGEVLVDVEIAGVNYADCVIRMGLYSSARKYVGYPITPGFEAAGRVAAVGDGVVGVSEGDQVFVVTRFGGYGSRLAVPANQVFPVPEGWSVAEAATFPVIFLTAWFALHKLAHARSGETALIHSAAGGVGGALLQFCRHAGVRALAVVGAAHKVDVARALGADAVIDKSAESLWPAVERLAPEGVDMVFDANGYSTLRESYRHLAPVGRLVVYGFHAMLPHTGGRPNPLRLLAGYLRTPRFNPIHMTRENRNVLAFNLSYLFDRGNLLNDAMQELLALVRDGALRPPRVAVYPLADAAQAHRDLESGRTTGKLALDFTQQGNGDSRATADGIPDPAG